MSTKRNLRYVSPAARVHHRLLMCLFHLAVNRYLYGIFTRFLARFFNPNNAVYLSHANGAPYKIYLNDGYWTRFALYHAPYEPEVGVILQAASGQAPVFCDLGANMGYWSTYAAGLFDTVIAVEASNDTFLRLQENAAHLKNVTLHRAAVFNVSGETMTFVNVHQSHASARLLQDGAHGEQDATEEVQTLAVDDIVPDGVTALIKLDVEGAEIPAIEGAARALSQGAVLIYEDHGNDHDCAPSAALLSHPEISLYSIENGLMQANSVEEIRRVKTDPFKGYNFLAARSDSPLLRAILKRFANPV